MRNAKFVRYGLVLILLLCVAGCGARAQSEVRSTTKGQELLDLDKAHKQGLMTDKEYAKAKKKILKRKY